MDFEQEEFGSLNHPVPGIDTFKESFDTLKKRLTSLRNEKENSHTSQVALINRLKNAEIAAQNAEMKLKMKCEKVQICDQEIIQLKALLEKANSENFRICSELCKLEFCLEEKQQSLNTLQKELDMINNYNEDMKTEVENLTDEKANFIKTCKDLEEKVIEKTREFTNLLFDRENGQSKLADITSKYKEATRSVEFFRQQLREQRANTETLQEKLQCSQNQLADVFIQNEKNKEKINALEDKNSELSQNLTKLMEVENTNRQKQIEINFLAKNVADKSHEVKELRKIIFEERTLKTQTENMLLATENKLRDITQKQEEAQTEIERFKEKYELAELKRNEIESKVAYDQNQIKSAEKSYNDVIEKLQLTISDLRTELKTKAKDVLDMQKDQLCKEYEIREFERCKNEKERLLAIKDEAMESLIKRNKELESEIAVLRVQCQYASHERKCKESNEERFVINHMLTQLSLSKQRFANNRAHQSFIPNQSLQMKQVENLEHLVSKRTSDGRETLKQNPEKHFITRDI